jgi:hypothetical protein
LISKTAKLDRKVDKHSRNQDSIKSSEDSVDMYLVGNDIYASAYVLTRPLKTGKRCEPFIRSCVPQGQIVMPYNPRSWGSRTAQQTF